MSLRRLGGEILNFFLHLIHLAVVGFSLTGWISAATRPAHLLLLLSTLVYWYGFGPVLRKKGWYGHCLITDFQWALKKRLGHTVPAWGYIKYLADRVSGRDIDERLVDRVTQWVFFSSLAASAVLLLSG
ncbi:MAG: DUF2784 family protein [Desulfobulbaceae bacterium]|nr:DUF2784 family protein [Desulfobulbaceae bacterium]